MPKYLISASYSSDGVKGLLAEGGTKRRETIQKLVTGMGGKMESFYYAFGSDDAYVIVDLPDHATMTALSLGVASSGSISKVNTTVLITPEEVDEATQKTVNYTPPGA